MMDNRRWDTSKILAGGVLDIEAPPAAHPKDIDYEEVEEREWSADSLSNAIKRGGLHGCMYFGIWWIWKSPGGYSGELFQYRLVTDHFEDESEEFALNKSIEWASGCQE